MKVSVAASVIGLLALVGAAQADTAILWDQSPINLAAPVRLPNAIAAGLDGSTLFGRSDVHAGGGGWVVNRVATYYSGLSWFDGGVTQAVLNVFPKTGSLPTAANDPRVTFGSGTLVDVTRTQFDLDGNGVAAYQVSGLSINLAPGDYWIGLTPIGPSGFFGPDLQWVTSNYFGASQASRGYPDTGWLDTDTLFNAFGSPGIGNVDGAISITGDIVPAPPSLALLGLSGLCAARRRRN